MDSNKAIALVVVLIVLSIGIGIPSLKFIHKKLDFKPAQATVRLCCN